MADNFADLASAFRDVLTELKSHSARDTSGRFRGVSSDELSLASQLAKLDAQRTEAQRDYAKLLGESSVRAKLLADIRKGDNADNINANKHLVELIQQQVDGFGEQHGHVKKLSELQQELLNVETKMMELEEKKDKLGKDAYDREKKQLELEKQSLEILDKSAEREKRTAELKSKAKGALAEIIGTETLAFGAILKSALDSFNTLRSTAGTSLQQTVGLAGTAGGGVFKALTGDKLLLSTKEAAELTGQLAAKFDDLDRVSAQSVANAGLLTARIGLSSDEATTLVSTLERIPGITPQVSHDLIVSTDALARINHLAPQKIFQQMAQHAEEMARYGASGAEQFAHIAAYSAKIGVDLGKLDHFADSLIDLPTSIENFARLEQLGIHLGDPLTFARMAETGDTEGIAKMLQRALGSSDLTYKGTGRTRLNLLSQVTGMSIEDIQRIGSGKELKGGAAAIAGQAGAQGLDSAVTSLARFTKSLDFAATALMALSVGGALKGMFGGGVGGLGSLLGGGGKLLGGMGGKMLGGLSGIGLSAGIGGAVGGGKGALWGGIGSAAGALIGSFIAPGIGTMIGSYLGGAAGIGAEKLLGGPSAGSASSPTSDMPSVTPSASQPMIAHVDTGAVEAKLHEILVALRSGQVHATLDYSTVKKAANSEPRTMNTARTQ